MRILVIIISFFSFFYASANEVSDLYIQTYKDIAISEMHRTGIPASIKLAQGLLESNWGRSDLATVANNHFGIKCGSTWMGGTFYKEDDDRNHRGEMIKSCFRSFSSPQESYIAHSDFLTDVRKKDRYGMLFLLPSGDYKSWAKGLKKSGYATDPKYPQKLIKIIEQYELYRYDDAEEILAEAPKKKNNTTIPDVVDANDKVVKKSRRSEDLVERNATGSSVKGAIYEVNSCRVVDVIGGESIGELSQRYNVSVQELITANEQYNTENDIVGVGESIYLDKKKRSYRGDIEVHEVMEGETMESISNLYGIRLQSLYAKNRMPKQSQTVPGEKLHLKKTVKRSDRPKFILEDSNRSHEYLFVDED